MTIILATSDYRRVPYADKIVVLNEQGQIQHSGSPDELRQNPDLRWLIGAGGEADTTTNISQKAARSDAKRASKKPKAGNESADAALQEISVAAEMQADGARQTGDTAVYKFYMESAGWKTLTIFIISIIVFAYCDSFPSIWLKWWAEANEKHPNQNLGKWLGVYTALAIGAISACLFGTW